ncbi:MAG: hypothetical protein R3C58_01465 [Parvularculaceae bacterium]
MAIAKSMWAGLAALALLAPAARADMGLAPLREVLTPDRREAEFVVSNPSDRLMEGQVSWIDLAATAEGYDAAAPELREALSAAPYLVVSPARFRLEPGARQVIRVRLKKGAAFPEGEHRSHLLVETKAERAPIRKTGGGLQVDVGLGVSAPVILRNGGEAKAKIGDTKLLRDEDGLLMLKTRIHPSGDASTYGRVAVWFTDAATGETEQLGLRENIAGYTDAIEREVTVPFGFVSLGAGEVRIRYEGAAEYDGVLFDERVYDIAPPSE